MFRTILAVLTFSVVASATTATFATSPGAMNNINQAVSASVTIQTFDTGIITVSLTDSTAVEPDAGALLSDLFFTLNASPTSVLSTTTTPTTAPLINIAANGSFTTDTTDAIASWGLTSSGATIHLDSLSGGATQTIIGPGPYPLSNNSIDGNPGHNPFINQTATFSFAVGGVTSATTITAASFSWGTTAGDNVSGCVPGGPSCTSVTTPEPISSALVGSGLIGLFFLGRRRMTRKA
jgi:hypothetical protein